MNDMIFFTASDASLRATGFVTIMFFQAAALVAAGYIVLGMIRWAARQ